jgi:hypothetical protein
MQVTNGDHRRYVGSSDTEKEIAMKKLIAALALTAAVATPALAAGYRQEGAITPNPGYAYDETSHGTPYRAPTNEDYSARQMAYGSYAYAPGSYGYAPGWDTTRINSPAFAPDPDPSVRQQLQVQSDISDR